MKKFFRLIGAVILCELAGITGSLFTIKNIPTWYAALNKPAFNPPNWLFGPVWTALYIMMGISLFLIWESGKENKRAQVLFYIQLILNTAWTFIFFGLHSPFWGFVEIIALWIMIIVCIIEFGKISRAAAYLLVPYLLWVSFASILTFSVWRMN